MKAGKVVRIRISPTDCLSVLDILEKSGIQTGGMSFASCVSLALSSCIRTLQVAKCIPEPDPFTFLSRMAPFSGAGNLGQKRNITEAMYVGQSMGLAPPQIPTSPIHTAPIPALTKERILELHEKREEGPLSEGEEEEYQRGIKSLYG